MRDIVRTWFRSHWQVVPWDIGKWAGENVRLPTTESADYGGGMYSIDNTPSCRVIFDFFADPDAKELHIEGVPQGGKTLAVWIAISWAVKYLRKNVMVALNSRDEVRGQSKVRLQAMLKNLPGFSDTFDDVEQSNLLLQFEGGVIYLGGANALGFFKNKPVSIVFLDEYNEHPVLVDGKTGTLDLARDRTKMSSRYSKIISVSQPEIEYDPDSRECPQGAQMSREFKTGDQRLYYIVCPFCSHDFVPDLEHLEYEAAAYPDPGDGSVKRYNPEKAREVAALKCPSCSSLIREGPEKRQAVLAGGHRATIPEHERDRRVWSARITSFTELIGNSTLGQIAYEYLRAKQSGDESALVGFNKRRRARGESRVKDSDFQLTDTHLLRHCGAYKKGTCPVIPYAAVMTVDVQQKGSLFVWLKQVYAHEGTTYVVDYGTATSMEDLWEEYWRPVTLSDGRILQLAFALIDEGDGSTTAEVRRFCSRTLDPNTNAQCFYPTKGFDHNQMRKEFRESAPTVPTEYGNISVRVYHFQTTYWKDQLYKFTLQADPEKRKPTSPPRFFFPSVDSISRDFLIQFRGEKKVQTLKTRANGRKEADWNYVEIGPNHFGDCAVMGKFAWALIAQTVEYPEETKEKATAA
jgi:phage terminase large subunit GpA-like protein